MEGKINKRSSQPPAQEPPIPAQLTPQQLVKEATGKEVTPVHEIETKLLLSKPNGDAVTIDKLKSCISGMKGVTPQPEFEGLLKAVVVKPTEGALSSNLSANPRFRSNTPDVGSAWVTVTAKDKPIHEGSAPIEGLKERIEYEDEVHDNLSHNKLALRLKKRLRRLGIETEVKREKGSRKRRVRYTHESGVHIEIDTLVDKQGQQLFPHYIEVEAQDRERVLATIEEVRVALKSIGITAELSGLSAKDLLKSVQLATPEADEESVPDEAEE